MGRSNAPPNVPVLAQPELPSASALSEPSSDADSTLNLVSRLSLDSSSSLVPVDGDSDQETVSSLSPTNDDHLYHDAPEYNEPNEVHLHQLICNDESHTTGSTCNRKAGGRAYGLAALPLESSADLQDTPPFPVLAHKTLRGVSASAASSTGRSVVYPIALAASRPASSAIAPTCASRPSRRAVIVGINYTGPNHDPGRQLRYGVNDARCVASSLRACGFPAEAVVVLTDQEGQEEPKRATHGGLISWIDWLVKDAKAGDLLVFFFSGHGCPEDSSLVMEDGKRFGKDILHNRLILSVPQNCDLHVILDCCSASSMIELQYCIGRMFPKPRFTPTTPPPAYDPTLLSPPVSPLPPLTEPVTGPSNHMAFAVALSGAVSANNVFPSQGPVMSDPRSSVSGGDIGFYHGTTRGGASVVAVSPRPTSAGTQAIYLTRTVPCVLSGIGQASINPPAAPSQTVPRRGEPRGRQAPIQSGQNRDYFLERPGPFVKPAGRVMFWASTGAYQSTFEAYNGRGVRNRVKIRNGIVPNAICAALDACAGSGLVVRDLWRRIVGHVEQENDWRRARDTAKPWISRPNPFFREQCAELWVSRPEPLSTAGPALDQLLFSA